MMYTGHHRDATIVLEVVPRRTCGFGIVSFGLLAEKFRIAPTQSMAMSIPWGIILQMEFILVRRHL
jgi:hypothetical protein